MSIEKRAIAWLLGDDTGESSRALCAHMMDVLGPISPPHDDADRGRCIRLLRIIPEWVSRLDEMKDTDPISNSLVFGAEGARPDINNWAKQIPLIKEGLGL